MPSYVDTESRAKINGDDSPKSPIQRITGPILGLKRVLSDGFYASTYIPEEFEESRGNYIPEHADPLGIAVTEAVRHGPFFLAFRDLWTCITMFPLFPGVIYPFWTRNPDDEFYLWGRNLWGMFLLSFASVFEVGLLLIAVPIFLLISGPIGLIIFVSGQAFIHLICLPMQGPSKVWSRPPTNPQLIEAHRKTADERWFFLNGCCVTGNNLQNNVNRLSETFGRPIFAIHNRTYGVLGDLFECILQRSFELFTEESRVCYEYIKSYILDPEVSKLVIIAHSQGCIMASQILDQLYVDVPAQALYKVEVYTFGNAAAHFNNPLRKLSSSLATLDATDVPHGRGDHTDIFNYWGKRESHPLAGDNKIKEMLPERVIPHIEHYCNSQDMVTRWGALYSAKAILQNRFCGHIFINEGASGHMLNQHYLQEMFPFAGRAGQGHLPGTASDLKHHGIPFLDRIVRIDTATVTRRDAAAKHQLAVMRHDSFDHDPNDNSHAAHSSGVGNVHDSESQKAKDALNLKLGEGTALTSRDISGAEGSRISVVEAYEPYEPNEEHKGRTVRQLSRLWRYMGGKDPDHDF